MDQWKGTLSVSVSTFEVVSFLTLMCKEVISRGWRKILRGECGSKIMPILVLPRNDHYSSNQ